MWFCKKEKEEVVEKSVLNTTNNNLLVGIIVVLAVVIAVMGFFLGKMTNGGSVGINGATNVKYDKLTVKVIKDSRDSTLNADAIVTEMKKIPSIAAAKIEVLDFADKGISDYLKENNIKALPAFIFSTKNFDVSADTIQVGQDGNPMPKINTYLQALPNGEFFLEVGSTFDPFAERSERGFRVIDKAQLEAIKRDSYIKGNVNAKITWLEYSDLECPYCAKLHATDKTPATISAKYGDDLNIVFNHFPLYFHNNAQTGAEILECLAAQKGSEAFYELITISYETKDSSKETLIKEAVKLGADETKLNKCLEEKTFTKKVTDQMQAGTDLFGVTGTPGNVLINNETGEYEVISGAYPADAFSAIIDKLK
ncbi:MAG: thioredoxin domain-containing protein [Candidatus Gracilibacteria bacterium]|nr:thioredoxin domain-containing protein [Candidatus Gracilibacteria bacterium]